MNSSMTSHAGTVLQNIVIRDIETLEEMREVEELQREIWGVTDLDVLPALALRPLTAVGAILIGAFAEGRLVGFVFGFPGILNGEIIIHSDILGVTLAYRSKNLGYVLKLAQRDAALARGVKRITWTFDPLQSRNAHLNFSKLGVIADRYYINYYGETSSFLHRFGTDRLWVTWLLNSDRVRSRVESILAPAVPELEGIPALVRVGEGGEPIVATDQVGERELVIEIPGEFDPERWREPTRTAFTSALNSGYVVNDFYVIDRDNQKVGVYLLKVGHKEAQKTQNKSSS
jgi:chorismate synthase